MSVQGTIDPLELPGFLERPYEEHSRCYSTMQTTESVRNVSFWDERLSNSYTAILPEIGMQRVKVWQKALTT
jgi:hypothetical protein